MRIASFLSDKGGSPLQGGLERGLRELGHTVEEYFPGNGYDLVIVFNQVAHTTDYRYPSHPGKNIPIAFVDCAEFGYFTRLKDRAADYANTFTGHALTHDTKNTYQQASLADWLEGRSFPYFLREMSNYVDYPDSYHPIDYPLYYQSHCAKAPNREEYLRRDLDLFLAWGESHPWRVNLTQELRDAHTRCEIFRRDMGAGINMDQKAYFARQEAAKVGVSFDGYGSSSFRMTEVLVRSVLLMGPLLIKTRAPLVDGDTCIRYDVESDGETFIRSNIELKLREALADPERAFEIYRRGHDHCMTHLTERATAEYLLRTVEAHDWSKPTELSI